MADTKISALASGSPATGSDEIVIARAGANKKLTLTQVFASPGPLGATTPAAVTATTGTFSGAVAIGNTVNAVSPTSPNRTITIVVGGTTLYVAAKTTND
jgi:hypothetical protein